VGLKLPNGYGLYDTMGNASEWVQDTAARDYRKTPTDGSPNLGDTTGHRVRRGGAFFDMGLQQLTPIRTSAPPTQLAGVRLVRDLPE
jgi:formylglycine-generating enzyme required for sulfatase activity